MATSGEEDVAFAEATVWLKMLLEASPPLRLWLRLWLGEGVRTQECSSRWGGQRPDTKPRGGHCPPNSTSTASKAQEVRGWQAASSSTAPCEEEQEEQ